MAKRLTLAERVALQDWEEFRKGLIESSTVDDRESIPDKRARIAQLEANPEEWFCYYFPDYVGAEPAPFHIAATKRLLKNLEQWYEVRAWSRELAKTSRAMMEMAYLALTKQIKNVLVVSNTADNAERLMNPLKIFLESSPRAINDYGVQKTLGQWTGKEFYTKSGCAFRAIGAGQSPRGTRNKSSRPDFILIDDIDTDEECRNPQIIKQKWKWIEEALIPTVSVSGNKVFMFNGNIIAKDCCISRAIKMANHVDIINIRDENGKSSWAAKNSEKAIDYMLSIISTASAQKEYFNNPISEGEIFTEMRWGACPPLSKLQFAVIYGDPSTSEKKTKGSSYKAQFLLGFYKGKYYIYTGYLDQPTFDEYVNRFYDLKDYVGDQTALYIYNENNSLQDPFWQNVFLPKLAFKSEERGVLGVIPDTRAKIDKYARIESALEPVNRLGNLILNIEEQENPHMRRLEEQFLLVAPGLPAPADGPDCIEGGKWWIDQRLQTLAGGSIAIGGKRRNNKRV